MHRPGHGGGNGGGGKTPFEILGLTDGSDDGTPDDDITSLQTGFVIEGTIDPSVVDDNFVSLTIIINGLEYTVDTADIDLTTGDWSFTYDGPALDPGTVTVDAYYTTAHPRNGKLQDKQAVNTYTFEIEGSANNPATISGDTTGNVTEDDGTLASGVLDVTDPDAGEDQLQPLNQPGNNGLGTFVVQADGNWTYALDNSSAAVQALGAGVTTTDTITVTSADGTDSEVITVTITGVNDTATVSGADSGSVTEDGTLIASGSVTVSDVDTGENTVQIVSGGGATYGTYDVAVDGTWTYTLDNSNLTVQGLNAGATLIDNFTVFSADGTGSQLVTITINGTDEANNPATISGNNAGAVTEDGTNSASGLLSVSDPDQGEDTLQPLNQLGDSGLGTFVVQANGNWTYTLDNGSAAVQALTAGEETTDTITVTSADGTDTEVITVTITGTNDVPTITGTTTGDVTEDGTLGTSGSLTVNDVDAGESSLIPVNQPGTYGTFDVQPNGTWSYLLDNTDPAVQALPAGQTLTDQITVTSLDGTQTETIVVTITGSNDVPVITGTTAGGVTEDGTTTALGNLVATDQDTGESGFQSQTDIAGTYGSFSITGTGSWSYTLNNADPAVQALAAGQTVTDSFVVTSQDGSGTETVEITITGTNDGASITGDNAGSVTEDGTLTDTGSLTVTDVDMGENTAQAVAVGTASIGGYGTYEVLADGTWTYTLNNNHPDVQALAAGAFLMDTFDVVSADGTATETVTITINGADEAPPPPGGDNDPNNDPLYASQWHLAMIGDIETVWQDFTGTAVSVGVYDNGVEYTHEDLAANYDAGKHVTVGGQVLDPAPSSVVTAEHGTAVSGVIAGSNNDVGGVGVSWGAMLTGVNIFGGPADINAHLNGGTVDGFAEAIGQAYTFDIVNNSWGAAPDFNNETDASILAAFSAFQTAVQIGRGGRGTIVVKAAGNDWDNAQGDYLNTTRYTITVAAHDEDGDASWYTNRGANVLVSAPSSGSSADNDRGITTTDESDSEGNLNDDQGYSDGNYTDAFGGTSSATPVVSGVVALMLEANPDLGWRDVQSILAYSAHRLGEGSPATAPVPDGNGGTVDFPVHFFDWVETATDNWNGGGQTYSEDYGFGGVNAYNAVRMAEVWHLFEAAQDSSNEISYQGALQSPEMRFLLDPMTSSFSVSQAEADAIGMQLEYVEVFVDFSTAHTFSRLGDITVNLISASGTELSLIQAVDPNGTPDDWKGTNDFLPFGGDLGGGFNWTFGITALRDEDLAGDWTIEIFDVNAELSPDWTGGTLHDIQFTFYGSAASADDVYHYTDEVFGLVAADASRLTLSDGGGDDWLNMAALAGGLTVNLATDGFGGASDAAQGTFLSIASGTQIENVVTGDGNDTITGNGAANELGGMRGNDFLWGLGGDDLFLFFDGGGQDWIGDFSAGGTEDSIALYNTGFSDFTSLQSAFSDAGADVLIDLGDGDQITLANVAEVSDLTSDDFLFFTT
ncbi:MAG: VCBS domain-containing protein [Paracoccaceae bacterium]|nr:VCBS domain-containing protein [Paracoccaceae bacterium]